MHTKTKICYVCEKKGFGLDCIRLCDCKIGQVYKIEQIENDILLKTKMRLLEFGFFKGQKIKVIKKSFLKQTLLVELMNNVLSLRSDVATSVMVTK